MTSTKESDPPPAPPLVESSAAKRTVVCFLCGSTQIYPGPRYENHLLNEHGVVFDVEFLIQVSLFKRENGILPEIIKESEKKKEEKACNGDTVPEASKTSNDHDTNGKSSPDTQDMSCQTSFEEDKDKEDVLCSKCKSPVRDEDSLVKEEADDEDTEDVMAGFEDEEGEENNEGAGKITAWQCPLCPKAFKRHSYFKQHACLVHEVDQDDIASITSVQMSEEEFLKQQEAADKAELELSSPGVAVKPDPSSFLVDRSKRKPIGKEWAPNSFSSTFTCYFCNEQFRKDYKLKLHLLLNHKSESPEDMEKAKEELTKSKLDGCIHKCALCGSKYNSVANFTRHIKDVHNMSRAEYKQDYGSSEVVSKTFKCELCEKEIKHTRNIIGAHMKMVHLISWKEYQDILVRLRQGESVGDLPAPELFECIICGVSVKYKREHLNKKHQINEDVYDELIAKKNRGEDISEAIPERQVHKCVICERECLDIKKHIERSHQISEEMYDEIVVAKGEEEYATMHGNDSFSPTKISPPKARPIVPKIEPLLEPHVPHSNGSSAASTDLHCYFGCDEFFKKDYQLNLHIKLKHRNEDPDEIKRAYEFAEEEIALTKRSGSIYECALCKKQFNDNGAFYGHISTKHSMKWNEYKDTYGRCEIESSPFECNICSRVIKYDRNTVHTHLKNVHGINWAVYLDRIRKIRRGIEPEELPQIEMTECKVCNINVKYLRDHLRNAHKITEQEYNSLFKEEEQIAPPVETTKSQPITAAAPVPEAPAVPKPPKSDIQDKTNKKCSSCCIIFDSRRSFIEHCTTVHNMKFKTKSGVTISAPSLMKQQQSKIMMEQKRRQPEEPVQGVKRKLEPTPLLATPPKPPKVRKPMPPVVDDESIRVEIDTSYSIDAPVASSPAFAGGVIGGPNPHRAPQYTPSGVSKWNQCRYECCFCKKTTMSRSSMTSHIHNTHGIPIKEYKESSYPDIEVETNWFQCRLCSARTKFVKDCIAPHLKMSHNMDIETYENQFMQPEDWPANTVQVSTMRDKTSGGSFSSAPGGTISPSSSFSGGDLQFQEMMQEREDKWNQCKFRCVLCEWVSSDSRQMRSHIASNHEMPYEQYVKEYGSAEFVTKKFRCELCKSEMKHCRQNIYAHMKDVHKLSLQQYEQRVDAKVRQAGERTTVEEIKESMIVAPDEVVMQNPYIVDNGNRPSRWNRCRFQCAMCFKLASEKRHIREHVVKAHGISMQDYEAEYGECEIHTEYFFCGVCHAEVKHNLKNISLHLNNVHKMSPQEYEEQFGRLSDEEVVVENLPEPLEDGGESGDWDSQGEDSYGFGAHFLLDENGEMTEEQQQITEEQEQIVDIDNGETPPPPPKSDITNPRCKFCRTCNREFNRRQAFVEHCRNIHGMKIKFATTSQSSQNRAEITRLARPGSSAAAAQAAAQAAGRASLDCDYCGKVFSNRSNRNRHIILSCEVRKDQNREANKEAGKISGVYSSFRSIQPAIVGDPHGDFEDEEGLLPGQNSNTLKEPQKCPYPGCEETHHRTALLKRHLQKAHGITNVSVQLPDLEEEKRKIMSPQKNAEGDDTAPIQEDERKVPPLKVKLSSISGDSTAGEAGAAVAPPKPPKPKGPAVIHRCKTCVFRTNNAYILNRHQTACYKRRERRQLIQSSSITVYQNPIVMKQEVLDIPDCVPETSAAGDEVDVKEENAMLDADDAGGAAEEGNLVGDEVNDAEDDKLEIDMNETSTAEDDKLEVDMNDTEGDNLQAELNESSTTDVDMSETNTTAEDNLVVEMNETTTTEGTEEEAVEVPVDFETESQADVSVGLEESVETEAEVSGEMAAADIEAPEGNAEVANDEVAPPEREEPMEEEQA